MSSSPIIVRRAGPADVSDLAALLSDMQAHYASPDPPGGAEAMARLLTREGERLPFALIAEHDATPVGLPRSIHCCSARLSVAPLQIARVGLSGNYARVEWTTDGTNKGAQRFYDELGVPRPDKVNYRLSGEDLRRLAGS